ncbi:MAG: hypothetical protein JRG80_09535 [Deltaproteobacteria bacterium]|nr:hypothetical protein [Deltaproteobacteria bacterium]
MTEEPPPISSLPVPEVVPVFAAATWRGPTDGPTGEFARTGPRTTGPPTAPTSTRVARAVATERTAETRSTETAELRLIRVGAATELMACMSSALASIAAEASATTRGFTICGATAWRAGA